MFQKISFYITAMVLLFALSAWMAPAALGAEGTNVEEWLNNGEPAETPVDEETGDGEAALAEDRSMAQIVGQLILYTVLIIAMIYGLIKVLAFRQKKLQPNQAVQLVGGTSLGNNKSLQLVKVGDKVLLIGVGDQVTLIKEFAESDEIGNMEKDLDKQAVPLSETISGFVKGLKSNHSETKTSGGFEQLFKQSLNKQKTKQSQLKQELGTEDEDKEGRSS